MPRQDRLLETSVSRPPLLFSVRDGALLRCGATPLVTPFLAAVAPIVAPFMAPFAPFVTPVMALFAPVLAAFHACGLSLGIGCRDHRCRHRRARSETKAQQ
jgi:hypothetical protein